LTPSIAPAPFGYPLAHGINTLGAGPRPALKAPPDACHGTAALAQPSAIERDFARALEEERRLFRRVLQYYRIPPEDAEDLVQETLLVAVTKWPEIESLGPWLYGALRLRCISYWRRRRTADSVVVRLAARLDEDQGPPLPPGQEHRERQVVLAELARRLPLRYRRLLTMRFQLGMTPPEVAAALGYSPGSVRKMVQRGLALLHQAAACPPASPATPARGRAR
jgi:RNA polymerase sigma-70 factor (ECF subfamily)